MTTFIIKFVHPFEHNRTENSSDKLKHFFLKFLTSWIPKANPDYENVMDKIQYWYIEVCEENGQPQREIGFDGLDNPIFYAPTGHNYGFWTDSDMTFTIDNNNVISGKKFEEIWAKHKFF